MKLINELSQYLSPNPKIKEFVKKEKLFNEEAGYLHHPKDLDIKAFLMSPEIMKIAYQKPINEDFAQFLAIHLLLKEKSVLDIIYMELGEDGKLNLEENTDFDSLTGLFWSVIMEKENSLDDLISPTPLKFDITKIKEVKRSCIKLNHNLINEINKFKDEIAKLHDGHASYTKQIEKLLQEKATLQRKLSDFEFNDETQFAEQKNAIEKRVTWLQSKINVHKEKMKTLNIYQHNGVKKYKDKNGVDIPEEKIAKIKEQYKKLLLDLSIEEEKLKKTESFSESFGKKIKKSEYEKRVKEINDEIQSFEKTRKGYQDYKLILNGRYENSLEKIFNNVSKVELIDQTIDYFENNRKRLRHSINALESSIEQSTDIQKDINAELKDIQRAYETCSMQEELISVEYSSLEELHKDIIKSRENIEDNLKKHSEFNEKIEKIIDDFSNAKVNGKLLSGDKISFFRSVLDGKLNEAKELHKQYAFFQRIYSNLVQNFKTITDSLRVNERQYKEQLKKIQVNKQKRLNNAALVSESIKKLTMKKDFLELFLRASPVPADNFLDNITEMGKLISQLSSSNEESFKIFEEYNSYKPFHLKEIPIINDLVDEFDENEIAKIPEVEALLNDIDELLRLEKEFNNDFSGVVEGNDSVADEIIKSLNNKIASLVDEISDNRKEYINKVAKLKRESREKEDKVQKLKKENEKVATLVLEGKAKEEQLLAVIEEERKRNKALETHIISIEERIREATKEQPFWKKNFVNTVSTVFFVGGLFYSVITDLPWREMELRNTVPFMNHLIDKPELKTYLYSEKPFDGYKLTPHKVAYKAPEKKDNKHLILDIDKYKVTVDASSFMEIDSENFDRENVESVIISEINRFCKEMNIDFNAFLEFYKTVYPNCYILKKENIEQATHIIYRMQKKYASSKKFLKNESSRFAYSVNALQLLTRLQLKTENAYSSFIARLFNEYHTSGYTAEQTKETILNNLASIKRNYRDFFIPIYEGEFKPLPVIEEMTAEEFIHFVTPYIKSNYYTFARQNNLKVVSNIDEYAHALAEDMFYSSQLFNVPKTFTILIAHQETFFHNIKGDKGKSEGPFQIYYPTKGYILNKMQRKKIVMPNKVNSLLEHKTFSTFMATFYMSDLMARYSKVYFKDGKGYVEYDLRRSIISYNGSVRYFTSLQKKEDLLLRYMKKYALKSNRFEG
ncbi:MAG: hypothetical protein HQK84_07190 [Nitrospinae bacterium]|nr:hypothetical protein [Nitrospinota bacterium]